MLTVKGEENGSKKSAWTSLPVQMMVGLVLGVVVGIFISSDFATTYLKPLGDLFIEMPRGNLRL